MHRSVLAVVMSLGLSACGKVCEGDFVVGEASDLTGLAECTRVTGSVTIQAPQLEDLRGLSSLRSVDGDLVIGGEMTVNSQTDSRPKAWGPVALRTLDGLGALKSVGGTLRVGFKLFSAFAAMVPDTVVPVGPVSLESLAGLSSLRTIGALEIDPTLPDSGNFDAFDTHMPITDLSTLEGVAIGDVTLTLAGDPVALPAMELDNGASLILSGVGVSSVDEVSVPKTLGTLSLVGTGVTDLAGFKQVESLERLELVENAALRDLSGLGATRAHEVKLVTEPVMPGGALNLTDVDGEVLLQGDSDVVAHLVTVGSFQMVPRSSGTGLLDGLSHLTTVGDASLFVAGEPDLSDLRALSEVEHLTLSGSITSVAGLKPGLKVARLDVSSTLLTDLDAWPASTGMTELTVVDNRDLRSLAGVADEPLTAVDARENPHLAQCLVDDLLASKGLPFDDAITLYNPTTNESFCACQGDGTAVCPDPRCTVTRPGVTRITGATAAAEFADVTCADVVYITNGPADLVLPNLVSVEVLIVGAPEVVTLSLPKLERVGWFSLKQYADNGKRAQLTQVDMPALTDVFDVHVAYPYYLQALLTPQLAHAQMLDVDCTDPLATFSAPTPLATLDLGALLDARTIMVSGCASLPACALDAQLAGARVDTLTLEGLDESCTCDASGLPIDGTCSGS